MNVFFKKINISLGSCDKEGLNSSTNSSIQLKFNSFHEFLTKINDEHWFPIYMDNMNWNRLEFICSIRLSVLLVLNKEDSIKDFKFVRLIEKS